MADQLPFRITWTSITCGGVVLEGAGSDGTMAFNGAQAGVKIRRKKETRYGCRNLFFNGLDVVEVVRPADDTTVPEVVHFENIPLFEQGFRG